MLGDVGRLINQVDTDCSPSDDIGTCGQAVVDALGGVSQWMDTGSLPPSLAADLHALDVALGHYVLRHPDNAGVDKAWATVQADAKGLS